MATATARRAVSPSISSRRRRPEPAPYTESVSESGLPHGSSPNSGAIVDSIQVSFTAGTDNANVALNASALTTAIPGLTWQVVNGVVEGFQNNTEVVSFAITAGATIQAGQTANATVTETLLATIEGDTGGGAGDLGTLNVVASDVNNPSISVVDQVSVGVVDDAPKANAFTASDTSGQTVTSTATTSLFGGVELECGQDGRRRSLRRQCRGCRGGQPSERCGDDRRRHADRRELRHADAEPGRILQLYGQCGHDRPHRREDGHVYLYDQRRRRLDGDLDADVHVNEVHPTANTATGTVFESGLPNGSNPNPAAITQSGTLSFNESGDTVTVTSVNGQNVTQSTTTNTTITGAHGTLTINEAGVYSYTLTSPESNNPAPDTFTYTVTDSHGNTNTSTLTFAITDDKPVAGR